MNTPCEAKSSSSRRGQGSDAWGTFPGRPSSFIRCISYTSTAWDRESPCAGHGHWDLYDVGEGELAVEPAPYPSERRHPVKRVAGLTIRPTKSTKSKHNAGVNLGLHVAGLSRQLCCRAPSVSPHFI